MSSCTRRAAPARCEWNGSARRTGRRGLSAPGGCSELADAEILLGVERRLRGTLERLHLDSLIHRQRQRLHVALRKRREVPERRRGHAAELLLQPEKVKAEELDEIGIRPGLEI